jgi:TetR/AcrR family transcriptional repressor of nem operon
MRKSRQETAQTRQRIVATAAAEFCRCGIAGTGLAEVMAAAGLSHGGFYRHFDSKDALVKESLANAVDCFKSSVETAIAGRPGRAGVLVAIGNYLSEIPQTDSCPFVTLGSELARSSEAVRDAATAGFLELADVISTHLDDVSPAAAKKEALALLATMVGAMTMARLVSDKRVAAAILAEAKKNLARQVRYKR